MRRGRIRPWAPDSTARELSSPLLLLRFFGNMDLCDVGERESFSGYLRSV